MSRKGTREEGLPPFSVFRERGIEKFLMLPGETWTSVEKSHPSVGSPQKGRTGPFMRLQGEQARADTVVRTDQSQKSTGHLHSRKDQHLSRNSTTIKQFLSLLSHLYSKNQHFLTYKVVLKIKRLKLLSRN
jgi:hypothetical protein